MGMKAQRFCTRILFSVGSIYFGAGCSPTSTQTLLNAEYLASGQSQIALISPLDNMATNQNPVLSWGEKSGLAKYLIEISPVADFSTLVLSKEVKGASYIVSNVDLIGITQLDPVQYYWRVSAAKLQNNLRSKPFALQVIETNVYYVSSSSSASTQLGNKSAPFKLIQDAINAATILRYSNSANFVSVRVAAGTYAENITLKPGISLYGGYSAADWSRNISANTSTINAQGTTAVFAGSEISSAFTQTTVVDGFTIRGGSASAFQNFGINVNSSSPTISNNTIIGGNSTGNKSCGIFIDTGSNPLLTGNSISGGSGTFAYGVQLFAVNYTLSNQTISSGTGTSGIGSYAVEISGTGTTNVSNNTVIPGSATTSVDSAGISAIGTGVVVISGNTINGGSSTGNQYGIIANPAGGSLNVSTNSITLGTASSQNYGVYGTVNYAVTVQKNTISAKGTNITRGISYASGPAAWNISGNSIHGGTGSNPIGIELTASSATIIKNNIINGGTGGTIWGILCSGCGGVTVTNNTINAGTLTSAGGANGIRLNGSNTMSITNNIIYSTSTIGSRYGVFEFTATSDPISLQNNLMFDLPSGFYFDENSTARILEGDLNLPANTVQLGLASGNMANSVAANFAMVNFISATDLHLTAATPLNIRCGGLNTSGPPGNVSDDFDSVTRTLGLTGTCAGASNMNAAGYSLGAYERD